MGDFPVPTYEQWREVVDKDLKGAPFEKKLIARTPEGIAIQPMYQRKDIEGLPHLGEFPGEGLRVRASKARGYRGDGAWEVAQSFPGACAHTLNIHLKDALARGQSAVNLVLDVASRNGRDPGKDTGCGLSLSTLEDWQLLFDGVDLEQVPLFLNASVSAPAVVAQCYAYANTRGLDLNKLKGCFGYDPLGALVECGELPGGWAKARKQLVGLVRYNAANAPGMKAMEASGLPYHEAGASATQELAFALAAVVEYLRVLIKGGVKSAEAAAQVRLSVGVGPQLFMEIAKGRAARLLWSRVLEVFGAEGVAPCIHARTGRYNKTVNDPYVNMLRTSTEAFSAVVGGYDSIEVGAFDEVIRPSEVLSQRIARNTHTILREECNLDCVIDPAGGSYYIETLTAEVAKAAWEIFQEVERRGGLFKALQEGYPQEAVAKTAFECRKGLNQRRSVLVGVNMYANVSEKPLESPTCDVEALAAERVAQVEAFRKSAAYQLEAGQLASLDGFEHLLEAAAAGATLGELSRALQGEVVDKASALARHRLAEGYEELRKLTDAEEAKTGKRPSVFLANMGPLVQHKVRADFIRGFFECGGFAIEYPDGFVDAAAVAEGVAMAGARVVVICSTDKTYPELVPAVTQVLKAQNASVRVLLAGHPGEQESVYTEAGLDGFIFVKSPHYETLKETLSFLGVQS